MLVTVKDRLVRDTSRVSSSLTFNLVIKGFSSTMNGYYIPKNRKLVLFVLEEDGKLREYSSLLETFIHELTHCMQYSKGDYKRVKGVMHDANFWQMYRENLKLLEV